MFFSKLGSELKYHAGRYNYHHFGMHDGAFGSEIFFLQGAQLLSLHKLINKKQRMICASQCKGKKKTKP